MVIFNDLLIPINLCTKKLEKKTIVVEHYNNITRTTLCSGEQVGHAAVHVGNN